MTIGISGSTLDQVDQDLIAEAIRDSAEDDARLLAEVDPDDYDPNRDDPTGINPPAPPPEPTAAPTPEAAPSAPTPPAPTPPAPTAAPAQAPAAAPAAPAPAPTQAAAPAAPTGNLSAALRVERNRVRNLQDQLAAKEAELAEARKKLGVTEPAAAGAKGKLSPELRRELEDYMPEAVKAFDEVAQEAERLQSQIATATAKDGNRQEDPNDLSWREARDPGDPAAQDAIDATPQLLAWQNDRGAQAQWDAAVKAEEFLVTLPAWKDRPLQERYAEVVKMVQQRFDAQAAPTPPAPPPPDPAALARERVNNAPEDAGLPRLGNMAGGLSQSSEMPDFTKMTDDQTLAWLARNAA